MTCNCEEKEITNGKVVYKYQGKKLTFDVNLDNNIQTVIRELIENLTFFTFTSGTIENILADYEED